MVELVGTGDRVPLRGFSVDRPLVLDRVLSAERTTTASCHFRRDDRDYAGVVLCEFDAAEPVIRRIALYA